MRFTLLLVLPLSACGAVQLDFVPEVELLPCLQAGATLSATASGTQPPRDTTFTGKVVVEVRI